MPSFSRVWFACARNVVASVVGADAVGGPAQPTPAATRAMPPMNRAFTMMPPGNAAGSVMNPTIDDHQIDDPAPAPDHTAVTSSPDGGNSWRAPSACAETLYHPVVLVF